ncbi:RNA polymerase sigma factor [Paenibacillus sp. GM2]|uniref:RNA polymerase sigma factor n=1 Tax=Paenibacillus sp. GM2 TaxID=1622070 RepID=UPI0008383E07|nr:RNA polymerase sigma factor [Paenibacillus sp. GM2]
MDRIIPMNPKVEDTEASPEWIEEHHRVLQKYCRSLTGSVWEGDDLAQETWMKVWVYVQERPLAQAHITRAFLYRAARNAWIDQGRRKRLDTVSLPVEPEQLEAPLSSYPPYDPSAFHHIMELMIQRFNPEQRTVLLLIDGLKFTAREVSGMLNMTEGAVKALLHRVRTKLKALVDPKRQADDSGKVKRLFSSYPASQVDESTVYAYIKAFHEQDAAALLQLMNEGSRDVLPAVQYVHKDRSRQKTHAEMKPFSLLLGHDLFRSMAA